MRRGVRRGGSPLVLRRCGKTGVGVATPKVKSRIAAGALASIVGGVRVFCWLFASRSVTQKAEAPGWQFCVVMPFDDGGIA
jgi:hypothetical protein